MRRGAAAAAAAALAAVATPLHAADKEACVQAYDEGQRARARGALLAARGHLLVCAEDDCPVATKGDCASWLVEVEASTPTLVLAAVDRKGNDTTAVKVTLDGRTVAERLDGKAIPVDPGKHVLSFEAPGVAPITREIVVRQGEKNRAVEVSWAEQQEGGPARPGGVVAISPGTWVLGGLGLAGLTVFGVFGGLALSEKSEAEETCAPRCTDAVVDSIRAKLIVADISLAVGVASLGAAVVLGVVSALDTGVARGDERSAWAIGLSAHPGGVFGVVSRAF